MQKWIQVFEIPLELPGLNEMIAAASASRYKYANIKRDWTQTVCLLAKSQKLKPVQSPVHITFEWHIVRKKGRPKDRDNIAAAKKFVLDGLVAAKILPDDDPKWVTGFTDIFVESKKHTTRVKITEIP